MSKRVLLLFTVLALGFLAQCGSSFHPEAQATGPQGPAGQAATVTVGQTLTGAPGSAAQVTNAGTSSAAVLNFVIPQGSAGPQGLQGPTGPQGPAGSFLPPLVSVEPATLTLSNPPSSQEGIATIMATINGPELTSITFGADVDAIGTGCQISVVPAGNIANPIATLSFNNQVHSVTTAEVEATLQKTVFSIFQPGTYQLKLYYVDMNGGGECTFTNGQISLQSYGAGSTMQSSGTF